MSSLGKITEQAKSHLHDGEIVQCSLYAAYTVPFNDHAIVVTNQRILVFELDLLGNVKGRLIVVDRQTPLGPFSGWLWSESLIIPPQLCVSWAFKTEIAYADSFLEKAPESENHKKSANRHARAERRVQKVRNSVAWLTGTEFDIVLWIGAFVFTTPWRLFRLSRLALRTLFQQGQRHYARAVAALAVNILVWFGAIGLGYLSILFVFAPHF